MKTIELFNSGVKIKPANTAALPTGWKKETDPDLRIEFHNAHINHWMFVIADSKETTTLNYWNPDTGNRGHIDTKGLAEAKRLAIIIANK